MEDLVLPPGRRPAPAFSPEVALLTGGADKPYALGLAEALVDAGISFDFIGSNEIDGPELHDTPQINFLNLRGDQNPAAGRITKSWRVLKYYFRLIAYAAKARPKIFHLLWNNKFELFDRTLLLIYYKLLGKRLVFTAHNVNIAKRDGRDTWLNRASLGVQYWLVDHIFVHTERMKRELISDFNAPPRKITVIPFGINNTLPNTELGTEEARNRFGLSKGERVLLFFGNIAPYKGLEFLIEALPEILADGANYRLLIAGNVKNAASYWQTIQDTVARLGLEKHILQEIKYIPDDQVEVYFKAADVLVLPYTHIFQSGVLFLGYSFGLPVIAADVGSLKEDIVEGKTGYVFRPRDAKELAAAVRKYFSSELFNDLARHREGIHRFANDRYSWVKVAELTGAIYAELSGSTR